MLIDEIKADQLQARKDRNTQLTTLLTTFYSEAAMIGKNDGGRATTDAEVHAVAKKFIKNANEVMAILSDDDDRTAMAVFEVVNLTTYLPSQLNDLELKAVVCNIIMNMSSPSPKDMGTVFKELKAGFDGQYDGKLAGQLIKELLK